MYRFHLASFLVFLCFAFIFSCANEKFSPPIQVQTPPKLGIPCNKDTVYFQNQILPLLVSTCAMSTCHNTQFPTLGFDLSTYSTILKLVKPKNPDASTLYNVISASDPSDKMPISPSPVWTNDQELLLKKWIEQGALNNSCNESYLGCDTSKVTYTNFIKPIMVAYCEGCHVQKSWGGNVVLSTFDDVKKVAQNGQLYGAVAQKTGYAPMPKFQQPLSSCVVEKIGAWIKAGMPK